MDSYVDATKNVNLFVIDEQRESVYLLASIRWNNAALSYKNVQM